MADGDALIGEYNASGTLQQRYVHGSGIDEPLVMFDGSAVSDAGLQYLHSDYQGSIIALSDSDNEMTAINTYDVYGIPHGDNVGRFAYTGQLALPEIGMYYYKAWIYHPKLGRFLQTDPVGYEDQMNLYAYVGNDPVNMVDPSGERSYLVSRPLGYNAGEGAPSLWANHNFIVTNAMGPGDPMATIISFGENDAGNMGRVSGEVRRSDLGHWLSLNQEDTSATYRSIDASDSVVEGIANSVKENNDYSLLPPLFGGANSNTGAGAVANVADGGTTFVNNGVSQPGSGVTSRVQFDKGQNSDNGMSSGKWKICSGMGAQKGGC